MHQPRFFTHGGAFRFLVLLSLPLTACVGPGKYEMSLVPSAPAEFHSVDVAPVAAGLTADSLDSTVPVVLRASIVETLVKSGRYQRVGTDLEAGPGVARVTCRISEFNAGSRAGRWLAGGMGVGRGHLDAACQFHDASDGTLYAEGIFTDELKGGLFGGGVNLDDMAEHIAAAVDRFMKNGRQ